MSRILARARATARSVRHVAIGGLCWCLGIAVVFGTGAFLVHSAGRPDITPALLMFVGIAMVAAVFIHIPALVRGKRERVRLSDGPDIILTETEIMVSYGDGPKESLKLDRIAKLSIEGDRLAIMLKQRWLKCLWHKRSHVDLRFTDKRDVAELVRIAEGMIDERCDG